MTNCTPQGQHRQSGLGPVLWQENAQPKSEGTSRALAYPLLKCQQFPQHHPGACDQQDSFRAHVSKTVLARVLQQVPFNKRIINKFLREYVTDNEDFEKVISALMTELSCCEYDDFQRIITQDVVNRDYDNEEYNEEDEKYYLHLEELLQQLTWLFTYFDIYTVLKEHTQLTHKEIDDIIDLLEETESFDSY